MGLISFFMFADQNLLGPNMTSIAEEFNIVDRKDQLLGGLIPLSFWLLGGTVSLLIGFLTDIFSRKTLFTLVVFIGEIPCLLSAFSDTYLEFFILRSLTGIGIGGIIPLTYSIIGDYYSLPACSRTPLLLGICPCLRGSCSVAILRALAKALKEASIM